MANPILSKMMSVNTQGVASQIPNLSMMKNFITMLKGKGNIEKTIGGLVKNHPMYKQAMQFIQDNGGDYQQAFYAYAQQNGIDPSQFTDLFN